MHPDQAHEAFITTGTALLGFISSELFAEHNADLVRHWAGAATALATLLYVLTRWVRLLRKPVSK